MGDSPWKHGVIPHEASQEVKDAFGHRLEMSLRSISLLVRLRLTKATMDSRPERVNGHTGTETQPRLLREAAAKNLPQWAKA